jgi:hypothetical protein
MAVFPNGPDPLHEGRVGFANSGHTMVDDFLFAWWNEAQPSPYVGDPIGTWCYADDGKKFLLGQFPTRPLLPANLVTATCDN